ncbi:hypothetical protein [Nisaea sp.]|uniref:glucosamine inositolphosphorylceramide transferase family protein n=1 Tax=Nisaea sp. TaxID=2024842 RepID=UPI003263F8C2
MKKLVEKALIAFLQRAEWRFASLASKALGNTRASSILFGFFDRQSLDEVGLERLYVTPEISDGGLVYRYMESDIEAIQTRNIDVLIRGGSGILKGDILTVCPFGVLSFHHGDNDVYRGSPAGFWEVLHREPSTGFVIQKLSTELDGGDVLFKGHIGTAPFYALNQAKLYRKANIFLHRLLEGIGRSGSLPDAYPKVPYACPLYRTPTITQQLAYLGRTGFHLSGKILRWIRGQSQRWSVAYLLGGDWRDAVFRRGVTIKNLPGRYLADPFLIFRDGAHFCFVEDYGYASGKGKISVLGLREGGYDDLGCALQEDFHLSYPYLFEAEGGLYMCPETHEAGDIRLYKCVNFPNRWELHKVIVRDVSAADTSIFRHNGKWWMLTNIDSAGIGDHDSELHVFHADAFDSENWVPHPRNPVVFDSCRARNGGFILDDRGLFRVFQIQGFDTYGQGMGVARIDTLDEEHYRESEICAISPRFFEKLVGTHSLSHSEGLTVFDFARIERTDR